MARRGWDSNPRVQSTLEQSNALTTRPPPQSVMIASFHEFDIVD